MFSKGHLPAGDVVLVKVVRSEVAARQPAASQGVAIWRPTPFRIIWATKLRSKGYARQA